jgi:hypothetical protein
MKRRGSADPKGYDEPYECRSNAGPLSIWLVLFV